MQTVVAAIPIPENETQVVIPLKSFAVSVQEVQPDDFAGQTFSALFGSNFDFEDDETINASGLVFTDNANATASLTLPSNLFSYLGNNMNLTNMSTHPRITQSVFLTDSLFLRRENNNLEVGSIIIAAAISGSTVSGLDPPIALTFVKRQVSFVASYTNCRIHSPC